MLRLSFPSWYMGINKNETTSNKDQYLQQPYVHKEVYIRLISSHHNDSSKEASYSRSIDAVEKKTPIKKDCK